MTTPIQCCTTVCNIPLDKDFWEHQWENKTTGWDIGLASPAIIDYFEKIEHKNLKILIPGCGSAYEAEWLVQNGFKDITLIDISPTAAQILKTKFSSHSAVKILCQDFFELKETYDIIIEQTFFCALPPQWRPKYLWKMHHLLAPNGVIAGLMFNKNFEKPGPPFGGTKDEYESLFSPAFQILSLHNTDKSIEPRSGNELWIEMKKNNDVNTFLYEISGITCIGCSSDITANLQENLPIKSAHISSDFSIMTIISSGKIPKIEIENLLAYDSKYKIEEINN